MSGLLITPSQTIGPFFREGMRWPDGETLFPETAPGRRISVSGMVTDHQNRAVPDALLEFWREVEGIDEKREATGASRTERNLTQRSLLYSGWRRVTAHRSRIAAFSFLLLFGVLSACARAAEAWPVRPVRIVAPFPPGGSADILGRLVAERLSATFKQNFIVDNRPGAGGTIGAEIVAKAAPDGYTLVV